MFNRRDCLRLALSGGALAMVPWRGAQANGLPALKAYIRTNWSQDPYTFGSYSYFAKGSGKGDVKALAKPIDGRIFFAGEATHKPYNSTVHAAYESGQVAAEKVAAEKVADTQARRVAVVGSGVSGMACAQALAQAGIDTTVFEARDRIGGRVWTDDRLGFPVDLGGSWIHGVKGNPLTRLADQLKIERIKTDDTYVLRGRGKAVDEDDAPDWLEEVLTIQHTAGAELDKINTWGYWSTSDYDGGDTKFPGGYSQIFEGLKGAYKTRLNHQVKRIALVDGQVTLSFKGDVDDASYDAVVVTVPLGALKAETIAFDPPLPKRKQTAIQDLGMGTLDKVYLLFESRFWEKDITWIGTPENDLPPGQFNQWLNFDKYFGLPLLMAFNGADPARELAQLSDEALVSRALQTLKLAYT